MSIFPKSVRRKNEVSDKKFGYTFSVILLIAGIWSLYSGYSFYWIWLGLSLIFGVSAMWFSQILKPLNIFWFYMGLMLQMLVSPLILFVLFLVFFIPVGIFRKIWPRKGIPMKPDPNISSYWILGKGMYPNGKFKHLY